uniref:Uncharacterized protein n=1 Tax=Cannabis sativa TaxID=3483 RepID=A0A803QRS1_CANSA
IGSAMGCGEVPKAGIRRRLQRRKALAEAKPRETKREEAKWAEASRSSRRRSGYGGSDEPRRPGKPWAKWLPKVKSLEELHRGGLRSKANGEWS